jgi:SNF2 family DNA or RNA helicase
MDPVTSYVYRYYFSDLEEALLQFVRDNKSVLFSHILELFMRLRQISITPFLLSDNSKPKIKPQDKILETSLDRENNPENNYYARLIHDRNQVGYASAKNAAIINTLNNIVTTNDENGKPNQVLVFSSFATELELLKNYYDYNNIPSGYIRGSDPGDKRTIILNDFRIGKTKILFLQYKTGSQGLNLTAANYVLTIDPWWNSTFEDQGVSRAYRSGQTRPVTWYRFITRRSVEEPIVEMAKAKKTITESYKDISKGNVRLEIPGLNLQELLKLIEGNKKSLFS